MPVHLRPSAPTAADAIVCGDPARALGLAQELLLEPRISNHHRGLWGYHGLLPGGKPLTIQATGLGGPSAAVVITELAGLGVERLIRVGTCSVSDDRAALASALILSPVLGTDGTTAALIGGPATLEGDSLLIAALGRFGLEAVPAVSTDLYYPARLDEDTSTPPARTSAPRIHDLQSAACLAVSASLGLAAATTAIVSRSPEGRLDDDSLEAATHRLGRLAADALSQRR